jgi:Tfp pilus assembly protein PilO
MGMFGPRPWEMNALIQISAQVAAVERKVNQILKKLGEDQKLDELAGKLDQTTASLKKAVDNQQQQENK